MHAFLETQYLWGVYQVNSYKLHKKPSLILLWKRSTGLLSLHIFS